MSKPLTRKKFKTTFLMWFIIITYNMLSSKKIKQM